MPTVSNLRPREYIKIFRKAAFADDYVEDLSLRPDGPIVDVVAPSIPSAMVRRPIGQMKEHADTDFDTPYDFADYRGHHFKIIVSDTGGDTWETVFVGYCEEQSKFVERADRAQGYQRYHLFGYALLLDKRPVLTGRVYNPTTASLHDLEWLPSFNAKNHKRKIDLNVSGNRSTSRYGTPDQYVFSREDGQIWTCLDIAEYVIVMEKPANDFFADLPLDGQYAALAGIKKFWRAGDRPESLWKWLCKIIDRRYGFGFYLKYTDGVTDAAAGTLSVYVFTTTDDDITVGPVTIPANSSPQDIVLNDPYPDNHNWEDLEFRETNSNRYERIECRGERMLMTCTFCSKFPPGSWGGGSFEPKWLPVLEDWYKDGAGGKDAQRNDLVRAQDLYDAVYAHFGPPANWPYKHLLFYGPPVPLESFLALKCNDAGSISNGDPAAPWYVGFHQFERTLPFHNGTDYWRSPPVNHSAADLPEFRAMFAFARIQDGPNAGMYAPIDRLSEADEEKRSCGIRPADNIPMGFQVHASPRHLWADSHWKGAKPSDTDPEMDFDFLYLTASWRLDTVPKVAEDLVADPDPNKVLIIHVQDAEFWYVSSGTIVDINDDGAPVAIHDDNLVLRDDVAKLQGVLAAAKAWFSKDRQAVEFHLKSPRKYFELGSMITTITGASVGTLDIRAVITKRTITFREDGARVNLETGWYDFDFAGAWAE